MLRLARLATHENVHGSGVGFALLRAVFVLAHQMARNYGCVGVLVDAKAEASDGYKRLGFDTGSFRQFILTLQQFHQQNLLEVPEVTVGCQDGEARAQTHSAKQKVRVGSLNPLASAAVEAARGLNVVLCAEFLVREGLQCLC